MRTIVVFISLTLITISVMFYTLWQSAFGDAKCTGVNPIPAMFFAGGGVVVMYLVFASTDWLNDFIAARASSKATTKALGDFREVYKTMSAQSRAMAAQVSTVNKTTPPQEPEPDLGGGLEIDEEMFQ